MSIKKEFFINILISLIPITFIAGNLFLNLNIFLIILLSLIFYKIRIFSGELDTIEKFLLVFFIYIFLNGAINDYLKYDDSNMVLIKSLSYFRFLILYFVIKFFIKKGLLNFKILFFFYGITCAFVVGDIIIQHIFRQDIFGYTVGPKQRVLSGPFGDEYIAGSFIQRFYIFAIYFIILFLEFNKRNTQKILVYFIIGLFFLSTLLAGNRIPLLLFVLILVLFFILEKSFRNHLLFILIILISIISINLTINKNLQKHYYGFLKNTVQIVDYFSTRFSSKELEHTPNTYTKEIETGILTWQQNKFFGGGIKSFYFNCANIKNSVLDKYGGTNCNTHPHNYYLQIASELGLVGLTLSVTIFTLIILKILKILFFSKEDNNRKLLIPFFVVFVAEIFPFKTTGSFFTSANSTYLFIIVAIILGISQLKEKIKL